MDSYSIGVKILLANNVSPVLAIISRDLLGVHGTIGQITKGFENWSSKLIGVTALLGGAGMLGAMAALVDKTKDYNDELVKLSNLGGSMTKAVADGTLAKQAFDISQRVPMKVEDLLKVPGSTYSILGEEESLKVWEPLARTAYVLRSQKDYHGDTGHDLQALIRAGELSGRISDPITGQIDEKKLQDYLDLATKITAATHGMVNPQTLLGMAQQSGVALRGLSNEGYESMAILAQAMGGPRAGTSYMSLWQQLAAGTMMKRTAEGMEETGLLKPNEWSSEGGHVTLAPDAAKRLTNLIGRDPLNFIQNLNDALTKQGITDPLDRMRQIMRITGRQTTQRMTAEEAANLSQILNERQRLAGGAGVNTSIQTIMDKSITANMEALESAWHNLLIAFAGPDSQNFIAVLKNLTAAINSTTAVVAAHPDAMRMLGEGIAAIGAALVGSGIAVLVASGVALGVPALIGAVVAGAAALIAINWQSIVGVFNGITNAISSFVDIIAALYDRVKGLFTHTVTPGEAQRNQEQAIEGIRNGIQLQSFHPGIDDRRPGNITLALNVDGQTLAQVVSDKLADLLRYNTNAPAPNGAGLWS